MTFWAISETPVYQFSFEINLISSDVNSKVPFNIGIISFCKSEEEDVSNDLLTEHFIDCACSSCIEADVAAIVLNFITFVTLQKRK